MDQLAPGAPAGGETTAIAIRLSRLQQLFNSFRSLALPREGPRSGRRGLYRGLGRRLSTAAAAQIGASAAGRSTCARQTLDLEAAIHNYFTYRAREARRRMRFLFREGRFASADRPRLSIHMHACASDRVHLRALRHDPSRGRGSAHRRLGRDVAAAPDFSLRLVADPPSPPPLYQARRNAGRNAASPTPCPSMGKIARVAWSRRGRVPPCRSRDDA